MNHLVETSSRTRAATNANYVHAEGLQQLANRRRTLERLRRVRSSAFI
jgi:hypothetical protein